MSKPTTAEIVLRHVVGIKPEPTDEAYIEAAIENYTNGVEDDNDILIAHLDDPRDNVPIVDRCDGGAWVRAWFWVSDEALTEGRES